MESTELKRLLALAVRAAQTPAGMLLDYFTDRALCVERKSDGSPVSIADREAENTIRTCCWAIRSPRALTCWAKNLERKTPTRAIAG